MLHQRVSLAPLCCIHSFGERSCGKSSRCSDKLIKIAFYPPLPQAIMDHYFAVSCGIAASVGVISHILYFVRGEHHQHTLQFLQIIFYGFLPLSLTFALLLQVHYAQAMQLGGMLIGSYLTGLWLSMLLYRSLFHRLKSFPGPRLATFSKFYQLFSGSRLNAFRRSHEAHEKYGNFVRTGRLILDLKF